MVLMFNNSKNPQNCVIKFGGSIDDFKHTDCELVLNDKFTGFRTFEEFKSIQKQLLAKGYGVDTTGILDLKTIKAYGNYKRSKIGANSDVGNYFSKKVYLDTLQYSRKVRVGYLKSEGGHIEEVSYSKYNEATQSFEPSTLNGWQKLKNDNGKCTGYYVGGKRLKTYKIPCSIFDSKPIFGIEKIKGLQYKLSDLGYDLDANGVFDLKTLEAYKDYEKKKKRNKKKK